MICVTTHSPTCSLSLPHLYHPFTKPTTVELSLFISDVAHPQHAEMSHLASLSKLCLSELLLILPSVGRAEFHSFHVCRDETLLLILLPVKPLPFAYKLFALGPPCQSNVPHNVSVGVRPHTFPLCFICRIHCPSLRRSSPQQRGAAPFSSSRVSKPSPLFHGNVVVDSSCGSLRSNHFCNKRKFELIPTGSSPPGNSRCVCPVGFFFSQWFKEKTFSSTSPPCFCNC